MATEYGIYTDKYRGLLDAYSWMCKNKIGTTEQLYELKNKISEQSAFLYEGSFGEPIGEYNDIETNVIWSAVYTILNRSLQIDYEYEMFAKLLRVAGVKEEHIKECKNLIGEHINFGAIS